MPHDDHLFQPRYSINDMTATSDDDTRWRFIDRQTYAGLKETRHALSTDAFSTLWDKNSDAAKHLSESGHTYIVMLNQLVHQVLMDMGTIEGSRKTLNEDYLEQQAKAYLNEEVEDNAPFYEIVPIDNRNHLVVVGRGFLHHVTQSKDHLLGYVLACLRCLDHFNCSSMQLNKLYLRLNYVKDYNLLIKNKAQC